MKSSKHFEDVNKRIEQAREAARKKEPPSLFDIPDKTTNKQPQTEVSK